MTLCPGETATATVAYFNSGSRGWVAGRMGEVAYLGTANPEPGQDQPSVLGGDGTFGSPNTGWPRYNRLAAQPSSYVGPGQVAWFQFAVKAPLVSGSYRIALRPLIEGAQWMEDYGVFWVVTVPGTGAVQPTPTPVMTPTPTGGSLTVWDIDGRSTLLAADGTYVGKVSSNKYDSDSICNAYGSYGSKYATKSVRNTYGSYGSPYATYSAYNPYTSTPPAIYYSGRIVGYLTKNRFLNGALDPDTLFATYDCVY
jgi:hypothetical protein